MLKKIKISDVRLGMYIQRICGKWIDHPFWHNSFILTEQEDLNDLIHCGLDELWIDTSQGLDVEDAIIDIPKPQITHPAKENLPISKETKPTSLQEELVAATKIHARAKQAIISMFNEARLGNAIDVANIALLVDELNQSIERNPSALLQLIRLKNADEYTYLHSIAVSALMITLGKQLGLSKDLLQQAGIAGLLHDVGKALIPDNILNKPGPLTNNEYNIIKTHPQRGWEILKEYSEVSELALDFCLHHHERIDGNGYPDKLQGKDLSLFVRLGAICDVYDAITSERCYKKNWGPAESVKNMADWQEGQFDKEIFYAFVKTIGIYPNGTLIRLKSEHLGIVIEQSKKCLTTPLIKVFFSIKNNAYISPKIIDLSKSKDKITQIEDSLKWGINLDKV